MNLNRVALACLITLCASTWQAGAQLDANEVAPWGVTGRYSYLPIRESSGVVASNQFPGVYWTLNDSGNPPVLYATTLEGELIGEIPVQGAQNIDWEDIAIDDEGQLWIGDIGNNSRQRTDLSVYLVREPNPLKDTEAVVVAQYPYCYPGENVDAEGMFVFQGLPYIVSKETDRAILHRFTDLRADEINTLQRVAEMAEARLVTGADLSDDGKRLTVCTYDAVWVYYNHADMAALATSQPWTLSHDFGTEAICFDDLDLVMTSESRNIYRLPEWWYERELPLPPVDALPAWSLLDITQAQGGELQIQSYRDMGIDMGGKHLVLTAESPGATFSQNLTLSRDDRYGIRLVLTRGPDFGQFALLVDGKPVGETHDCCAAANIPGSIVDFGSIHLEAGEHTVTFRLTGKPSDSANYKLGVDSYLVLPDPPFARQYLVLGPFARTEPANIDSPLPPEHSLDLNATFRGAGEREIAWQMVEADANGCLDLKEAIGIPELSMAVAYALVYVHSRQDREATLLVGSDDQVAVWMNAEEVHRHNVARAAKPDQDTVVCQLKAGWNEVLCKIGDNGGGWMLYLRVNDPDGSLQYALEPSKL